MKKITSILLSVLVILSMLVSCNTSNISTTTEGNITTTTENKELNLPANPTDEDYLQVIYEVDSSYYGSENNYNHKNLVSQTVLKSVDKNAPETKKVMLNNVEYEMQYSYTYYHSLYAHTYYCYTYGKDNSRVMLTKDGEIRELIGEFDTIDIGYRATPEEVLPKLKEKLKEYVDISKYNNVKMPNDHSDNEYGFGSYDFKFYNSVDGYMTDLISVYVKDDGAVYALRIYDWDKKFTSLNIDKNLEDKMLELKFKDIYTTDTTEYISYKIDERFTPQIIIREGVTYVCYTGSARLLVKSTGTERNSYVTAILIPLELISNKA